MIRTVRWLVLGVCAVGCLAPKITLVDSFPDGGSSGGETGGSPNAGAAGRTNTNGGGLPMSGNSSVVEAGAGGIEEAAGVMNMSGGPGGGTGGATAGAGGTPSAGSGGASPGGAAAGGVPAGGSGGAPPDPITKALLGTGCGLDPDPLFIPGTTVKQTIATSGTKPAGCADSVCGPWSYMRDYYVTLPVGYDKAKAYPVVFEGPGCGGLGSAVYPLTDSSNVANAGNTVIRVGWTPPPNAIGHATNPNQGCFDDREGDDSVDYVLYETLYDKLTSTLCVDRNRVFASGNSSGASLANGLGCKYAGDATRPIRGVLPNTGGLTTTPAFATTCTTKPMAGMWIHELNDPENAFSGTVTAINRAITVNGCTGGPWGTAPTTNYAVGGGNADTVCQAITGCPALYPLVVCALPGNAHASHDAIANPGFSVFLKAFLRPPLLSP